MFKDIRWKLTIRFISLSLFSYILIVLFGLLLVRFTSTALNSAELLRELEITVVFLSPIYLAVASIGSYAIAGAATRSAAESLRALTQFAADAGHELNTPLAITQANLEALEFDLEEQGISSSKIEAINSACQRMRMLIHDLLLLVQFMVPERQITFSPVTLDTLVGAACQEYSELFAAKEISLELKLQSAVVIGDLESLKAMFTNLLQNALRYTLPGGCVTVAVTTDTNTANLVISDTGSGIAPDKLPYIFDRFFRGESDDNTMSESTGLGLSIVKAIVDAHRGRIDVASSPGKGSLFAVTLPAAKAGGIWANFFARRISGYPEPDKR